MTDRIIAEFEAQLASLARDLAGDPKSQLDLLWPLGIEREAIVTVAYRRSVIEDRLQRMSMDDEARAVIARAIRWAWRDEQAHTLWVRGALLRRKELSQRARAFAAQIEGWIGGWVSSRQNHLPWREAPVSRLIAEGIEAIGVATGRIPDAVHEALHWNTFADFCRFNRSAETTAAIAWRRMSDLAISLGHTDDSRGFLRMAQDEERHARIFGILADAFDKEDRLLLDAPTLLAALESVGQRFVAAPGGSAQRNPLGKGGRVVVREDRDASRAVAAVLTALAPPRAATVAIKTTFMLVTDRRNRSPGVSMAVLGAVIAWFREHGARVRVIDACNYYDAFHQHRSVSEVARYLGLEEPVMDAQNDQVPHAYARGMDLETVSATWRDAELRVVLGKLRSHPTAQALFSLEAAEGLGTRTDEHLFAERRSERETAVLMTLDALPPHLALLDAFENVPDGLMGVWGSEPTLAPHRIYGSSDAVALDAVACAHVGADPTHEGSLVAHAFDWFGDPRRTIAVDGTDTPIAGFRLPDHSARTALLSTLALPVFNYASARGALFLPEFDEAAFPPIEARSAALSAARAVVKRVISDSRPPAAQDLLPTTVLRARGTVRLARIGAGDPIVLLHGYPETLQVWSRLAPLLASKREVIAFDWPGLGYSSRVSGPADPYALAEQLREVLDALGLERVDLIGADMGGPPALVFASKYRERVGRVIVMSSLLFGDEPTSVEISVMRRAGLASAAFRLAPSLVYAQCKQTFLPDGEVLDPAIDADFAGAFHRPEVREHLARMCQDYEQALPRLPEAYWTVRNPVRLLWAEHDGHFPPRQAERMCELLPEAERVVVAGARHWMALSRAREVADHVEAFLS